jgi:protein O-mannosyl-transferase
MSRQTQREPPVAPDASAGCASIANPGGNPSRPVGQPHHRWRSFAVCLLLALAVWIVFGQTLGHEFVNSDDQIYITDNPTVLGGLSLKGIVWAFTHNVNVNWTPLTVISHMVDCQLYGTNAGGHHLTNVLLHLASVIVLFLVLKGMTAAFWRSAFVAAVFAIHPLHVESVAWIAERRDVLSGLFFMLTLGAYARYVRHPQSLVYYLVTALMLALALMSKPMVVTLPFVLLLLDYWPLNRFARQAPGGRAGPAGTLANAYAYPRLIAEKLPLLALSGAVCAATLFAQTEAIAPLPFSLRIGNAMVSYVAYLGQMFYPVGLVIYYPHPGYGLALWKMIAASIVLLVISAIAVIGRRKRPWFLFGWLWYSGMLVPVSGLIQSGLRAQADRYTYLPQIGLSLLLAWGAVDLCVGWRHRRPALGAFAAVILVILILCARIQATYWQNSEVLWTHELACTTDNYAAHNYLGSALFQKGNLDEAIVCYRKALQINADYAIAHYNLGVALLQTGQVDEAISHYQRALQIKPDYTEALNNLAWLRAAFPDEHIRNGAQAVQYAERACELTHYRETMVVGTLAAAYAEAGRFDEAVATAQKACALATESGQPELLRKNQELLELYRKHQPYHEAVNP